MRTQAECNVCLNSTQMACVSETQYQFCVGGIPSGAISLCPTNYVCSTTTNTICLPQATGAMPTCNSCNTCNSNLVFACTGVNTYTLCSGTIAPTGASATCPAGQVCDINSPYICVSSLQVCLTKFFQLQLIYSLFNSRQVLVQQAVL